MELETQRQKAADFAFSTFDFGDLMVSEAGGWNTDDPEDLTRTVIAESPDGEKVELNFHVRFDCVSAEAQESYALNRNSGEMI